MKRNLDQKMFDLDGKEFSDKATLKTLCFSALAQMLQGDGQLPADRRMQQFDLLKRLNDGGVIELTVEELGVIKERARQFFPVILYGRLCEALEKDYEVPPKLKSVA